MVGSGGLAARPAPCCFLDFCFCFLIKFDCFLTPLVNKNITVILLIMLIMLIIRTITLIITIITALHYKPLVGTTKTGYLITRSGVSFSMVIYFILFNSM